MKVVNMEIIERKMCVTLGCRGIAFSLFSCYNESARKSTSTEGHFFCAPRAGQSVLAFPSREVSAHP